MKKLLDGGFETTVHIILGTPSNALKPPTAPFTISTQKKQVDHTNQWPNKMAVTVIRLLLFGNERLPCLIIVKDTNLSYFSLMFVKKFQILFCRIIGCDCDTLRYELLF